MTSEVDNILRSIVFDCPFSYRCVLEKKEFLCKLPECKECPDYKVFFKELKHRQLF